MELIRGVRMRGRRSRGGGGDEGEVNCIFLAFGNVMKPGVIWYGMVAW